MKLPRLEPQLLEEGTFVGEVTPLMIDIAKALLRNACRLTNCPVYEFYAWSDFIPQARKMIAGENKDANN